MARLQNEVGTKDFLRHEFSPEKCSEYFPENFEPLFRQAPVRFGSVTVRGWNG